MTYRDGSRSALGVHRRNSLELDWTYFNCQILDNIRSLDLYFRTENHAHASLPNQPEVLLTVWNLEYVLPSCKGSPHLTILALHGNFQLQSQCGYDHRAEPIFSWIQLPRLGTFDIRFHGGAPVVHECEWDYPSCCSLTSHTYANSLLQTATRR